MTIERKIVVGLDDIKAIVFECPNCHSRLAVSPDKVDLFPQRCSRCPQQWVFQDPSPYTSADSSLSNFLRSITELRVLIKSCAMGVRVLLEFDEPKFDAK